ncbi:hypothetical protein A3K86_15285 [Photobacterium jeanii]|uniref:diguanylate cyclase n=1 Tax=Photobacterium jeanii TaxID=858640 RepID=A0A178K6R3_9GAMM|nr:sensor domain-containing diguanylate cyclase [Photobacterium jeanii]OAN13028.1 hypothetical protein A3K86_15285 [Photobacterium jeanii]PST89177.1 PAS domain S-box protein [Photobacterium jeanii]
MSLQISKDEKVFIDSHYGVVVHRDFKPLYADDTYANYFGYSNADAILSLPSLLDLIAPKEQQKARQTYQDVMSGKLKPGVRSYKNIDNSGNELIVLTVDHVIEWQGEPAMQITIIDLSSQIEMQRQLKASEKRYRELVDGSIQGILVHRNFKPLFCNRAYSDMHGYQSEQVLLAQDSILPLITPQFHQQAWEENAALLNGDVENIKAEVKGIKRNGETIWLSLLSRHVIWDGEPAVQVTAMDITEQNLLKEKLEHQANYDGLTNLLNRRASSELLVQQFNLLKQAGKPLSCVMIDLDNFKLINDHYGHLVGDEVLRQFAKVSSQNIRQDDIMARWGGEEFILILPECSHAEANVIAQRLCQRLNQVQVDTEQGRLNFSASMGIATMEPDTLASACVAGKISTVDQLLVAADRALYQAKRNGKNCVVCALQG